LALLVVIPQGLAGVCHASAWRTILRPLGGAASTSHLFRLYVSAEAARMVAPAGAAVAESIAAIGLVRLHGTTWGAAIGSLAVKKAWTVGTHAAWMLALLLLANDELATLRVWLPTGIQPWWFAAMMTISLALGAAVTILLLSSRRAARWVTTGLTRAPLRAVRAWAELRREQSSAAARLPAGTHGLAATFLAGQWATEVFETWLILRLLGVDASLPMALLLELGGSMVRSLAFMVPGGVGVQDATYVATLSALGVPGSTEIGAAFVVLKRLKDLLYVALGLTLLGFSRRSHGHTSLEVSS
jgi:uncharacterized protein (TIRG00374 family)